MSTIDREMKERKEWEGEDRERKRETNIAARQLLSIFQSQNPLPYMVEALPW